MNSWKLAPLGVAAIFVGGMYAASAFAQAAAPPPAAESTTAQAPHGAKKGEWQKYRKSDVQATMTKVGQDVWHAQLSGASAQHMQQLFLEGQRAYFKGDYDGAMHSFLEAEQITKKYPNDITGGRD